MSWEPPAYPTPEEARRCIEQRVGFTVEGRDDCWLWHATPNGYGPFLAFFETVFGELPPGMQIYHICPNAKRGCVRPRHLDVIPDDMPIPDAPLADLERARFGRRIADERAARRYSLVSMAKQLGVASETLKSWERGWTKPGDDVMRELSRKMGWDDEERYWTVTMVVQRVVKTRSAGAAARKALDSVEIEGEALRAKIVDVGKHSELRRRGRTRSLEA